MSPPPEHKPHAGPEGAETACDLQGDKRQDKTSDKPHDKGDDKQRDKHTHPSERARTTSWCGPAAHPREPRHGPPHTAGEHRPAHTR
ncbi:hypothetical protein GCM10010270_86900 [Streptomyces violaceus]|nr:hypothetical protein GCM10010270_86900 [Streptomyces janthinus]